MVSAMVATTASIRVGDVDDQSPQAITTSKANTAIVAKSATKPSTSGKMGDRLIMKETIGNFQSVCIWMSQVDGIA